MNNSFINYKSIDYFKGLNSLRFFAALLVLIHHSETMKLKNGIPLVGSLSLFSNGFNAVTFFFVLSGFLITYLLLKEKNTTQTVNVKKFYLKRVLRIWPLYYLLILIGVVIVPFFIRYFSIDYEIPYTLHETWYFYVFFLPGLVTFYYGHHLLEPLWSIGVEELFYLIWAPFFKFIKDNILLLLLSVIVAKILLLLVPFFIDTPPLYNKLVSMLCFEAMAIGGLGAYFVFNSKKEISSSVFFKKIIQIIVYTLLIVFIVFNSNIENPIWRMVFGTPIISPLIIDFMFLYLIIGASMIQNNLIKLDNKVLSYFGEISYGIYMYHTTVISIVIVVLRKAPISLSSITANCLFYFFVIGGVLLLSHLSKKYFENYFLNLQYSRFFKNFIK